MYRDNPPGPSCSSAVQELSRLSQAASIEVVNPLQDWKWTNMDLVGKMQELSILFNRLSSAGCIACSQFERHVRFNKLLCYNKLTIYSLLVGTNK